MKKKHLGKLLCMLCLAVGIVACDNDNYGGPAPDEVTANYSNKLSDGDRANFVLTYSGREFLGKSVYFETNDCRTAELTLLNVLPGEKETPLTGIALTANGKGGYDFRGNAAGQLGTTFAYEGTVTKDSLVLAMTDVKLTANPLTSVGKLSLVTSGGMVTDSSYKVKPDDRWPTRWQTRTVSGTASLYMPLEGGGYMDLGGIVGGMAGNFLKTILNEIRFGADGNITADYAAIPDTLDVMGDLLASGILNRPESDWKKSPVNLASYYVVDDTVLYVIPNVDMIIREIGLNQAAATKAAADGADLKGALQDLYAMLNRWTTSGIKLIVKKQTGEYTLGTSRIPTYMRDAGDYAITLRRDEVEPLFDLIKALPEEVRNISLGTVPLLGEMKVGTLADMLGTVTTFYLTFYFNVQPPAGR